MSRLLHPVLALAAFLLTASWLRAPLPWPGGSGVSEKWQYFEKHADEYEVVLIGSSRVYRSFDPRAMERVWRDDGKPLQAFNLAAPGVGRFEADFLAGELLAMHPKRLRLLVIELWRWDPNEMKRNEFTPRAVHWHTLQQTLDALESCWSFPSLAPKKRFKLVLLHLQHFAQKQTSIGRGRDILAALKSNPEELRSAPIRQSRGYRSLESEPFGSIRERRETFLDEAGRFEAAMLERHAAARSDDPGEQLNQRALERRVRSARAQGIEIVFVVPPGPWAPPEELELELDPLPAVISYSDRQSNPTLYREAGRFDRFHVTDAVAKQLSRQFARALLPYLPAR